MFEQQGHETYIKVKGQWLYLYRAIDSNKRLCCTKDNRVIEDKVVFYTGLL
ncbi:DDE-type integrase/transposase/recombinase [Holosporaceae bacterium 'Namur']|nr:DDE-type integrase/transposase/recombinase [Holosporaceae bacterium 'Namur']